MQTKNKIKAIPKEADLKAQLEAEEARKDKACIDEINATLKKYNRALSGSLTFIKDAVPQWTFTTIRLPNV